MKKRIYWHFVGIAGLMTAAISILVWTSKDREQREYALRRSTSV